MKTYSDLYDIFCAILYVVKGGIRWRMLPAPSWKLVVWTKTDETGNTETFSKKRTEKIIEKTS